eukprot:6347023-Amphidinium_carterae.1
MASKGKGKQKGKPEPEATDSFEASVLSALPAAAHRRLEPRLLQSEWSVVTCQASSMAPGRIAFVPKSQLVQVLRLVGETALPTAIVTTQPAHELHLRGYKSQVVVCTILQHDDAPTEGEQVRKFVTQVGFGTPVVRFFQAATTVTEVRSLVKCSCRWTLEAPNPITDVWIIQQICEGASIPRAALGQLQQRHSTHTAYFYVQAEFVSQLLKRSGQMHIYYKVLDPDHALFDLCILWLPDSASQPLAVHLATADESILGLAVTLQQHREMFGLRFIDEATMQAYAEANQLTEALPTLRWKSSGWSEHAGTAGVIAVLAKAGWSVQRVVYLHDHVAVFDTQDARGIGEQDIRLQSHTHATQVRIKAVNAAAKKALQARAQGMAAPKIAKALPPPAIAEQRELAKDWLPKAEAVSKVPSPGVPVQTPRSGIRASPTIGTSPPAVKAKTGDGQPIEPS